MATIDLFTLIFQDVLKISPNLLYKYTTLQDQIFNLIFLPHVVLFLFLFGFGMILVPEGRRTGQNKGLRYLVTAAAYIFIIYQGWYGTFLVPLLQTWFTIMLGFSLFLFFIAKIFPPFAAQKIGQEVGKAAGGRIGKELGKGKELEALQKELDDTQKTLNKTKQRLNSASNPWEQSRLQAEQASLEDKIRLLKREIDKY